MKKKFINYGKHSINKADIKSIVKVFNSDFLTQGSEVIKFEKKLKKKFKSKYCTVVSSGTAALHLACRALEFKRNDIIFCSPLTFVSSVNSILFCGAKPYLIDINEVDYNLDINKLEENIKLCKKKKKNIKGIVVTDYAGHPASITIPACESSLRTAINNFVTTLNSHRKAVGIATGFVGLVSDLPGVNPAEIWGLIIQRLYTIPYSWEPANLSQGGDLAQSWKRSAGWALEEVVVQRYSAALLLHGITISKDT